MRRFARLEIKDKIRLQFCEFWSPNRRPALCCQRFSITKYEHAILVCKEAAEHDERSKEVTSQLNYATIELSSE